ncbi:MAG: hypothetical protein JO224_09035 [Pelomonas sp.]|nr:hypothetical protein [Roseateles sp.]
MSDTQPRPPPPARPAWVHLWAWPIALGLLTASGLVAALVSDGPGRVWSWFALGLPVVQIVRFACCAPRRAS